jgi:hypothetical protein
MHIRKNTMNGNTDFIKAITPLFLGGIGAALLIVAILAGDRLSSDRFSSVANVAALAIGGAAGVANSGGGDRSSISADRIDRIDLDEGGIK